MKLLIVTVAYVLLCLVAFVALVHAQDGAPVVAPPAPTSPEIAAAPVETHTHFPADIVAVVSPKASAPAALVLSSVAVGATDYSFIGPITGRQYNISARQQVALTGAILGVALMVRHLWPRTQKYVDVGLYLTAAGFAGKAYANSQTH